MRHALLIAVLLLGPVAPLYAEGGEEDLPVMTGELPKAVDPGAPLGAPPDFGALLARTAAALAVVFVALGLFLWLLKRFSGAQVRGKPGLIDVLETRAVLPKWSLSVVRFGDELLLLSHCGERVSVLSSTSREGSPPVDEPAEKKPEDFRDWFARALNRPKGKSGGEEASA
jgi:flagellar biogenesis protein FliO